METGRRARLVAAALTDAAALLAFAAAGRRNHAEGSGAVDVVRVAAPFLLGWFGAAGLTGLWRQPLLPRAGVLTWAVGVPVGLALRRVAFGRGLAPAFVVVALLVTGIALVGWRLAVAAVARGQATR